MLAAENILETINMIQEECLDIRTITMGISLYDCQSDDSKRLADRIYDKIMRSHLTMAAAIAEGEADIAIGTERISRQIEGIDFIPLMEERFDLATSCTLACSDEGLRSSSSTSSSRRI